jgi:hypothetical protein
VNSCAILASGSTCRHSKVSLGISFGVAKISTTSMVLQYASTTGCERVALTTFSVICSSLTKNSHHTEISFTTSGNFSRLGTKTWQKSSLHHGYHVSMKAYPLGPANGLAQGGCLFQGNQSLLEYHSVCCGLSGIMWRIHLGGGLRCPVVKEGSTINTTSLVRL